MSKGTVLVVEDESITALDIQQSLRRQGYHVPAIAATGLEAIALARDLQPDLLLVDIRLNGDMDGIEAARLIRKDFNIPVVFLTAYADGPTLQRAKIAEPFAYLLKPFEETVLVTAIEIALHKHRSHERLVQETLEALRVSEERFERLAQCIADYAIIILDATGRICSWNAGAQQLHGWDAGETMGRNVSLLYPAPELARGKPAKDLEAAERAGRTADYAAQARKDGGFFSAKSVVISLRDAAGRLAGFLKVTRPVAPGAHN